MKNTVELFKLALVTTMATLGKTELHVTFHTIPHVPFSLFLGSVSFLLFLKEID